MDGLLKNRYRLLPLRKTHIFQWLGLPNAPFNARLFCSVQFDDSSAEKRIENPTRQTWPEKRERSDKRRKKSFLSPVIVVIIEQRRDEVPAASHKQHPATVCDVIRVTFAKRDDVSCSPLSNARTRLTPSLPAAQTVRIIIQRIKCKYPIVYLCGRRRFLHNTHRLATNSSYRITLFARVTIQKI